MEVAPRRFKLHFSDLLYYNINAFKPHKYILQLIETLPTVTNGP